MQAAFRATLELMKHEEDDKYESQSPSAISQSEVCLIKVAIRKRNLNFLTDLIQ